MYLARRWRNGLVATVLLLTVLFTGGGVERYGDNLQVALPMTGLGCAVLTGGAGEYTLRYVAMWLSVHSIKRLSGEASFNRRPNGGVEGFPSGHTSASAFGASALVNTCVQNAPLLKAGIVIAAGFVGGTRIEVGAHNVWQVLAGALFGLVFERAFRRSSFLRGRLAAMGVGFARTIAGAGRKSRRPRA